MNKDLMATFLQSHAATYAPKLATPSSTTLSPLGKVLSSASNSDREIHQQKTAFLRHSVSQYDRYVQLVMRLSKMLDILSRPHIHPDTFLLTAEADSAE